MHMYLMVIFCSFFSNQLMIKSDDAGCVYVQKPAIFIHACRNM